MLASDARPVFIIREGVPYPLLWRAIVHLNEPRSVGRELEGRRIVVLEVVNQGCKKDSLTCARKAGDGQTNMGWPNLGIEPRI
jgi:hypothetical protein